MSDFLDNKSSILKEIKNPGDIKNMSERELLGLAENLREAIIETTSKNGGHLASNLGMIEATIALHRVFSSPHDSIIFDVGHQCYAHKLLTGRCESFDSLRSFGGISGFTSPDESEHDRFFAGHCGASLSAALGIAERNRMLGSDAFVVVVIGDASFSNGMVFEAMNNCIGRKLNLIILLNDNKMSISKTVGGLSSHLSKMRTSKHYFAFKHSVKRFLGRIPVVGERIRRHTRGAKDRIRRALIGDSIFECMGLDYLGPVDGNDIIKLESVLNEAKTKKQICVVHMITKKGKGYYPAEAEPERYHSVAPFDPAVGVLTKESKTFSSVFGDIMCECAERDEKLCAITAAMCVGTGLDNFINKYKDRFFDVGIEEEHAVAFAGGLGVSGMHPVFAVYSTFLQRTYDQIFHDVALQSSPVIFAIDRAGLVAGDGKTHQGLYDCSLLSSIPGMEIYSPDSYDEMKKVFENLFERGVMAAVRYPRGEEQSYDRSVYSYCEDGSFAAADYGVKKGSSADITVITYGRVSFEAAAAAVSFCNGNPGFSVRVIRLCRVYPADGRTLLPYVEGTRVLYLLEEGIKSGGIAEKITAAVLPLLSDMQDCERLPHVVIHAVENRFISHGSIESLYEECGFTSEQLVKRFEDAIFRISNLMN